MDKIYTKLNLRQLQVEVKRISRQLALIQLSKLTDEEKANHAKVIAVELKKLKDSLMARTGVTSFRCALPKKKQRELGLLPQINGGNMLVFES